LSRVAVFGREFVVVGRMELVRRHKLEALRSLRKEYQKLVDKDPGTSPAQFLRTRLAILEKTKLSPFLARRFATKVLEAVQIVDKEYVKEVDRGQLVAWAIRGLYQRVDEKIPEEIADRLEKLKDPSRPSITATLGKLLADARAHLGQREDLDKHKDIDIALQRMLSRLDPYTTYIDPETVARFEVDYKGQFDGIGVQIRKDSATGMLQIVTPIPNSPSYRIPLLAGDLITTITREVDSDGNPLDRPEVLQTKDLSLGDAVKKILGKKGTRVTLTIQREGEERPFDVTITRGRIELESVKGARRKADDSWDFWLDVPNRIGYIRLSGFARRTADDLTDVVRRLRRQGMQGLVLDLRFNPGGLLKSAHEISDLFIKDGPIVSIRRPRLGEEDRMEGKVAGSELGFKMVCLVNGQSASASEIVSACLQDHLRAKIMGERSYGKGSVQNIQEFDGGQLKITIASFWRPSGKNLNKSSTSGKEDDEWGVKPDKVLELSRKEREDLYEYLHNTEIIPRRDRPAKPKKSPEFKDRQLDMALKYLREELRASR
jgi:C-terminal peptidase prc